MRIILTEVSIHGMEIVVTWTTMANRVFTNRFSSKVLWPDSGAAHGYICATQKEMDQCYTQFPEDTTTHTSTALSTRTSEDETTTQDGTSVVMSTTDMPGSGNSYPLLKTALTIFIFMLIWADHLNTAYSTFCTVYSKFAWYSFW